MHEIDDQTDLAIDEQSEIASDEQSKPKEAIVFAQLSRLSLSEKLVALVLAAGILPVLFTSVTNVITARVALENKALNQLEVTRATKKAQVERYFSSIRKQIESMAAAPGTIEAMEELTINFNKLSAVAAEKSLPLTRYRRELRTYYEDQFGAKFADETGGMIDVEPLIPNDPRELLAQYRYIAANPHALGEKDNLDTANDGTGYAESHAAFHPATREFLRAFGYYDIFLIEPDTGHIVYSVFKELDYATSLETGPYADTNFARAFRQAKESGETILLDYEPYVPSYNSPASFIATPIKDGGRLLGVLIFQMPVDEINSIMMERTGLGETGETYLLGTDKKMRSQSRFTEENTILAKEIDTDAFRAIAGGDSGFSKIDDYRGVPVLSSYSPLEIDDLNWGIVADIDVAEGTAAVGALTRRSIILSTLCVIGVGIAAVFFARRMTQPIVSAVKIAQKVSEGDLTSSTETDRHDEIGELLRALGNMQTDLSERIEKDKAALIASNRITEALNKASAGIMITDDTLKVIYVNETLATYFGRFASEFTRTLAGFRSDAVVGSDAISLFKDGQSMRVKLENASAGDTSEHEYGSRIVEVVASPVLDENGTRRGTVLEWNDLTETRAREIEEREKAEQDRVALIESSRITEALNKASSGVMITDDGLNVIYVNETLANYFKEYRAEFAETLPRFDGNAIVGLDVTALFADPQEMRKNLTNLKAGDTSEHEYGSRIVDIVMSPVLDDTGSRRGTVLEWNDLTEIRTREAEERVKAEEDRLALIESSRITEALNKASSGVMITDDALKVIYVNETLGNYFAQYARDFSQALGQFDASRVVGAEVTSLFRDGQRMRSTLSNLTAGETTENEYGSRIIDVVMSPVVDATGTRRGTVLEWNDLTEIRVREAEEREKAIIAREHTAAVDAMQQSQCVVEFDLSGKVLSANQNFLNAIGSSPSEVEASRFSDMIDAENSGIGDGASLWENLNRGIPEVGEFPYRDKQGNTVWFASSFNPIPDLNDKPFKVVQFANDITAQKRLQQTTETVLNEAKHVMGSIAEGDLTLRMSREYGGEFDVLSDAVNQCAEKLTDVVTEIRQSSSTLSTRSVELSEGNSNLSNRTIEQAASLEQTASSMQEMTSTVARNAENANEANTLAQSARSQAEAGGNVVEEAIEAISEIDAASSRIANIISVIDEIAFQTNLLALNASVEAARAGEQGRGFAVVASEVRNLAGRSAEAAKEIKDLIQDSVSKVADGSVLVNRSGESLKDIVVAVRQVSDIVSEIAAASSEQSSGIDQVNKAVHRMDEMTQQNSALVERATMASAEVKSESGKLSELIGFFATGDAASSSLSNAPAPSNRRHEDRPWSNPLGESTRGSRRGNGPRGDPAQGCQRRYQRRVGRVLETYRGFSEPVDDY